MPHGVTRRRRLKVRRNFSRWLGTAAIEGNPVYKDCNASSYLAATECHERESYPSLERPVLVHGESFRVFPGMRGQRPQAHPLAAR